MAGRINNGILLGVNSHAKLITLSVSHAELFPSTGSTLAAVGGTPICAIISSRYDSIIIDDNGAILSA